MSRYTFLTINSTYYIFFNVCNDNICMHFGDIKTLFFPVALRANAHGLPILEVSKSRTTTHHSRYESSGRVISASQRPLPDNTQHSKQTDIHAPGGIRTLGRRAAVDLCLIPRGHWDRRLQNIFLRNATILSLMQF